MTHSTFINAGLRAWAQRRLGPVKAVRGISHPRLEEHALMCLSALDAVSCPAWAPHRGGLRVTEHGRRTLDGMMAEVGA